MNKAVHTIDRTSAPCVSVVIAARNEEVGIKQCLQSIVMQEGVGEVIVVDDHSSDRTAAVAASFAQEHPTVRLISAPTLPEGWTGKTHALAVGSNEALCQYILFTDADVVFSGTIISDVVQRMQDDKLDFAGGLFSIRCESVGEKVCAPVLAGMARVAMFLTAPRLGAGTGAFNMVKRAAYLAAGGHAAIRDRIVDDVALARLMRGQTKRTALIPRTSMYVQVRLFEGWCGYWRAIERSAVPFLGGHPVPVIVLGIVFAFLTLYMCSLPVWAMENMIRGMLRGDGCDILVGGLQISAFVMGAILVEAAKGYGTASRLWSLLYPVPLILMVLAVMLSTIRMIFRSKLTWRGREYDVGKPRTWGMYHEDQR